MQKAIKRRRTFYLSGFDPRGARHYHRLYREQAKLQANSNGFVWHVSGRKPAHGFIDEWEVRVSDAATEKVSTTFGFLRWDDIVRQHWAVSWLHILRDFWLVIRTYWLSGLFLRYFRLTPPIAIIALYPILFVCFAFVLAVFAVAWGWKMTAENGTPTLLLSAIGLLGGLALAFGIMRATMWLGHRLAVFWLLQLYAFSARWSLGAVTELETRIDAFATRVVDALQDPEAEEVLLVSHSMGCVLAISVMARVLAKLDKESCVLAPHRLVLVTLGHSIPLTSFLPAANTFRLELQSLALDHRLLWVDYTAPTDGACFSLLNPITVNGLRSAPGLGPIILSPRFFKLYSRQRYRKLRWNRYTMHFLYLMASEYAGAYDYFGMTAGPLSMKARLDSEYSTLSS